MTAALPVTPVSNARFYGDMTREQFELHVKSLSLPDLESQEDYTSGRIGLGEHNGILFAELQRRKEATPKRDHLLPQPW